MSGRSESTVGLFYTTGAFVIWGLAPLFWKLLAHVPSTQLVAYRILCSGGFAFLLLAWRRELGTLRELLDSRRTVTMMLLSTALIGANWFLFIWAVNSGQILAASLGYYINPLINVVLGMAFLGERLRRLQAISVGLAVMGVTILTVGYGELPWLSLVLAGTFGLYGLVRKTVAASPEQGLAIETWLLSPLMLAYILQLDDPAFRQISLSTDVLLVLTGAITAVPLLFFVHGARRLPLATVGILQYLAPTGQFLLAVFVFKEPFALPQVLAFALIWTALAVFTYDARRHWE